MSVQRLQAETTSTEFNEWLAYLDLEVNAFHREDYYLAMIAAEVRKPNSKDPSAVQVTDFILKFDRAEEDNVDLERATAASKNFWFGIIGAKPQ